MSLQSNLSESMLSDNPTVLFVGGCYRSGTTLLEKLLHQHDRVFIASQPFPDLYIYCKSLFYKQRGIKCRYPLEHLFLEEGYTSEEFIGFLNDYLLTAADISSVFDSMDNNRLGLWTPDIVNFRGEISPGCFFDIYQQLMRCAVRVYPKQNLKYMGGKEVLSEEYIPFLLSSGGKAILSLRDPRDMITSLNFRERDNGTGDNRPVLYSLRVWRKSVAIALAYNNNPNFFWIKYEDLVTDSLSQLNRIADFLDITIFSHDMYRRGIFHQDGSLWRGNSSFQDKNGVSKSSVGNYKKRLPEFVTRFIEATCMAEMRAIGYQVNISTDEVEDIIKAYQDPFADIHGEFPEDYSSSTKRVKQEIERFKKLRAATALEEPELSQWFLFKEAYQQLQLAMTRNG